MNDAELRYVESLKEHKKDSMDRSFYSVKRIDLLIISISSFGILFASNLLKQNNDKTILTIGVIVFGLSVIINFISQWVSYYGNIHEYHWAMREIELYENNASKEEKDANDDNTTFSFWISLLNITSTVMLILGVLSIIFYFLMNLLS